MLAVVVESSRYTIFVDQKQSAQVTEQRVPDALVPALQIRSIGGRGSVRVVGARLYELPP